jgi:hypothetical protein
MPRASRARSTYSRSFADAEQPVLLRALRRCSLESDHARWESLRGRLSSLGYSVVMVRGVEHLLPLEG